MDGLRYLAEEIEVRRHLLHGFVKDAGFLRDVIEKGAQHPEEYAYIKNGSIDIFPFRRRRWTDPERPNRHCDTASTWGDLTFAEVMPYLGDFYDSTKESLLLMPIEPSQKPPEGYKVELTLMFVLGGGGHGADAIPAILARLLGASFPREFRRQTP